MKRISQYIIENYIPSTLSKKNLYIALVLFIIFLGIYTYTMNPMLPSGDSGELSTAVQFLGVPHAPGYSLLMLLSKPFTYLPIKTVIWRLNFFSAFCGAITVSFLFLFLVKLFLSIKMDEDFSLLSALGAICCFGFSKTFWSQTALFEVYTLSNIFYPLFLLVLLYWLDDIISYHQEKILYLGERYIILYAFIFGLGVTAHLTILMTELMAIFFIATILYAFVYPKQSLFDNTDTRGGVYLIAMLVFVGMGYFLLYLKVISSDVTVFDSQNFKEGIQWFILTQVIFFSFYLYDRFIKRQRYEENNFFKRLYYLGVKSFGMFYVAYFTNVYLYIRGSANTVMNWGGIGDEVTFWSKLEKTFNVLWRKQYGDMGKLPWDTSNFFDQLKVNVLIHNGGEYTLPLIFIMCLGIFYILRQNLFIGIFLLITWVSFNLQMILYLSLDAYSRFVESSSVFFIFSYMNMSIFMGLGMGYMMILMQRFFGRLNIGKK